MSQQKEHVSQNSRLDKFLFYSKFAMLIIVAILFLIAYSFFQRDLPSSNAHSVYYGNADNPNMMAQAKVLFVMVLDKYSDDSYEDFYKLNELINSMPNCNYDVVLFKDAPNTLLNNINDDLLIRIYQDRKYQYIISVGDSAVDVSKDIKELFFPSADIFLYSASFEKIQNTIPSIASMEEYIKSNISAAKSIDHADKFVFLCSDDEYSSYIIKEAEILKSKIDGFDYTVLNTKDYTLYSASSYINDLGENTSVFYVSFGAADAEITDHSHILDVLHTKTNVNVYDLSALNANTEINDSLRLWQLENNNEPLAYLGITQDEKCAASYELIEYIAGNIMNMDEEKFHTVSSLIDDALASLGLDEFPEKLDEQLAFCLENSLTIDEENLQAGDLVFTSTTKGGPVDGIYIYVNENMVIDLNKNGIIAFTQLKSGKYPIAYARPCSLIENKNH